MTHRIGAKGQVVIPKQLRDRAGLHPGSEVEFRLDGTDVVLQARGAKRKLGGSLPGADMAAALLEDRRREPR
jgi:AbrB family looped-hinge helix DNA binding protein